MPRRRRYLIARHTYEVTLRAKRGLPFPASDYMNLLILSVLARVQRDSKVSICDFITMANHLHFLIVVYDHEQAIRFLQETKKKLTDVIKRVLGIKHLNLWEESSIILYPTEEDIRHRIAYFYLNPAKAGLESSIESYPGLSSWEAFRRSSSSVSDEVVISCPWISADNIPVIKQGVSPTRDKQIVEALKA